METKTEMEEKFKQAIESYQCCGCMNGGNVSCFEANGTGGVGCGKHKAGTIVSSIGHIFLGMPKGFNSLGIYTALKPNIYDTFESSDWTYDMWNIPFWKHLTKEGHTMVRGYIPRRNEPFIHIFLENCIDKINCLEISQSDVDAMD